MLLMLAAFAMGLWLGAAMDGTPFPMANGMWFWGVATAAVAWLLVWRTEEVRLPDERVQAPRKAPWRRSAGVGVD